jgi:hypothetical protein
MKKMRIVQLSNGTFTAQVYDETIPNWNWAMYCDGKINSFTSIDDVKKEVNVIAETCSQDDVILHRVIEELDV